MYPQYIQKLTRFIPYPITVDFSPDLGVDFASRIVLTVLLSFIASEVFTSAMLYAKLPLNCSCVIILETFKCCPPASALLLPALTEISSAREVLKAI